MEAGIAALVERLAEDPRVHGVARLAPADDAGAPVRLLIVSTWDGLEALSAELPALGGLVLQGAEVRAVRDGAGRWAAVAADARRVELEVTRIGDLKPSARGEEARALLDPKGLVEQWARWSRGRKPQAAAADAPRGDEAAARAVDVDEAARFLESLPTGAEIVRGSGRTAPRVEDLGRRLRELAAQLDPAHPVDAALLARVAALTCDVPLPGEGVRVRAGNDPAAAEEAFYAAADAEGFRGDRPLFLEARARLAELGTAAAVFDEGFALPTFDAVEARFALGVPVGGCKPPLQPAVHVGVGVTPRDALELWAAPAVREALGGAAAVADDAERTVVPRDAGRTALLAALRDAVERAWERLPGLLRSARDAARTEVEDPRALLETLHLPRSHVEAALRCGAEGAKRRLVVVFALTRAAESRSPLVARKLSLAAGRLLAETPVAPGGADPAGDCAA